MFLALDQKRLSFIFCFCLLSFLTFPLFFFSPQLTVFAPFLVICIYQKTLKGCLWLAQGCGLLYDLFYSSGHMGFYALDFCLVTLILYPLRRYFFGDHMTTLPFMTIAFSLISAFIMEMFLYNLESYSIFFSDGTMTELLKNSLFDGAYAFVFFILPVLLLNKRPRRSQDYFLNR